MAVIAAPVGVLGNSPSDLLSQTVVLARRLLLRSARTPMTLVHAVLLPVAVLWAGVDAPSAPPAARRLGLNQEILQRFEVPGTGYETVIMRVEFPADYEVTRHSHPGPQASYVLYGEMTYLFDGQPPATRVTGESKDLPGYAIHGG